jgi:predicted kinase
LRGRSPRSEVSGRQYQAFAVIVPLRLTRPRKISAALMELAILVGMPASGKTSFVRARLAGTHRHVSKDLLGHGRGDARQRVAIEAALRAGDSVVVDNINATPAERARLITLARSYGARVVGYYFGSAVLEALARNRLRTGAARVPDVAIYVAARRLQPPSAAEGFEALFRVGLEPNGGFTVTAWPEDRPAGGPATRR